MRCLRFLTAATLAVLMGTVAACDEGPKVPVTPAKLTREHRGHYCRMIVVDHKGPKGQIHLKGRSPVFFSSVRDTIAFTMLPEESKQVRAIFVNDMSNTPWDRPGPDTWMRAEQALYVIGSSKRGGMGAAESVPFRTRAAADSFAKKFGGRVVPFDKIPRAYILGEAGTAPTHRGGGSDDKVGKDAGRHDHKGHGGHKHQ